MRRGFGVVLASLLVVQVAAARATPPAAAPAGAASASASSVAAPPPGGSSASTPTSPSASASGPSSAAASLADEKCAAKEFAEGRRAFDAGDFVHAGEAFERAYACHPHHSPLWNAARAWESAGEDVRAANLYARYLREAPPDARDRDHATADLKTLSAKLGRLEMHGATLASVRVDGRAIEAPILYVAPGEHVAVAQLTHPVRKVVRVEAGQLVSVTLEPPALVAAPALAVRSTPAVDAPARGLSPAWAIGGGIVTAVLAGLSIASGFDTVSKKHEFLANPTEPGKDTTVSAQTRTNIALGATVGLGLVTGVVALFFTNWHSSPPTTMAEGRYP